MISSAIYAQEFVSPIGFVDNEANRQKVIAYIKKQVKEEATAKGETNMIEYYEQENLKAFKELIKVKNTKVLEKIIKEFCDLGSCSYMMFLMAYLDEDRSYVPVLEW